MAITYEPKVWWYRPGEIVEGTRISGSAYKLKYLGDGLPNGLWSFALYMGGKSYSFLYDVETGGSPGDIPDGLQQDAIELLNRILDRLKGLNVKPASVEQAILDQLAETLEGRDPWLAGAVLRNKLSTIPSHEVWSGLARLQPKYIVEQPTDGQRSDRYALTFIGAHKTKLIQRIPGIIDAFLPTLGRQYREALARGEVLRRFDLRLTIGQSGFPFEDQGIARRIIQIADLVEGGSLFADSPDTFVSADMEELSTLSGYGSLMEYARNKGTRPSTTAPVKAVTPPYFDRAASSMHAVVKSAAQAMTTTSRTPWRPTPWAFISSVRDGLQECRDKVMTACLRARILPVGMESWSAVPRPSVEICRKHVNDCDVVILVLGYRYGSLYSDSGKSYTEVEFEEAQTVGKDVLAFELTEIPAGVDPSKIDHGDLARLQNFKTRLGDHLRGQAKNSDQLEARVLQALNEWQQSKESTPA